MSYQEEDFDKILFECVYNMFVEILGQSTTIAVFHHLGIDSSKVKTEVFAENLERIFGSGAYFLEKRVLENLYSQAGKTFQEKEGHKFTDYVNEVKALMATEKK